MSVEVVVPIYENRTLGCSYNYQGCSASPWKAHSRVLVSLRPDVEPQIRIPPWVGGTACSLPLRHCPRAHKTLSNLKIESYPIYARMYREHKCSNIESHHLVFLTHEK